MFMSSTRKRCNTWKYTLVSALTLLNRNAWNVDAEQSMNTIVDHTTLFH